MKEVVLLISNDSALAGRVGALLQRLPVHLHWQRGFQPPSRWIPCALVLLDEESVPGEESLPAEDAAPAGESAPEPAAAPAPSPVLLLVKKGGVRRAFALRLGFLDVLYQDHRLSQLAWVVQEHLNALRLRRARQRQEDEAEPNLDPRVFSLRHEINNPLAGIVGNAELALACRGRLPHEVRERLERILQLTHQISQLLHVRSEEAPVGVSPASSSIMEQTQAVFGADFKGHSAGHSL